jgi:hypothetical protein
MVCVDSLKKQNVTLAVFTRRRGCGEIGMREEIESDLQLILL